MSLIYPESQSPRQETLEDGTVVTRTCAWSPPGCHAVGCGVKLFVKDGELVKVEGDPEHPLTRGRLCVRCLAFKEYLEHPDRLRHPMKRAREDRGKDKWERITWDEATQIIVEKVNEIKEKWGPESIILYGGTGREPVRYAFAMQAQALGTPNYCYAQSGWSCMGPRNTAFNLLMGSPYLEYDYGGGLPLKWDDPDFVLPEYVLLVGKEPLKSNPDGLFGHALLECMKRGTKLIIVDPRTPWVATRADEHVALRPNTDAAFVLAVLNVICSEDLVNHDFIDRWCYGYDELAEHVKQYTPAWAAEVCGIPEEQIYRVARKLAWKGEGSRPWGLCVGVATDQNPNGPQVVQALSDLVAITGYLDVPGGTVLGVPLYFDMNATDEGTDIAATSTSVSDTVHLPKELTDKTIGWKEYPALPTLLNTTHPDLTLEALETDKPYPIKMAWIDSTNLLSPSCSAQPKRWHDALRKMEFVVAKETFMTPTVMALADIVLPLSSWAQHNGIVLTNMGSQTGIVGAVNKVLDPEDTMSDLEMLVHFGKALNPEHFKWESAEQYLDNDMRGLGSSWEELREKVCATNDIGGYYKYERGLVRTDGLPGFATTTGRFELYSIGYEALGDSPLPYYLEPPLGPVSRPDLAKEYPFILTTGARNYSSFHSEHRQIPTLRALTPDPIVEIHPDAAAEIGVHEGEWVWIENPWGRAKEKAHLTPAIRRDTVAAAHGWWFPEEDGEEPNLFGVWKSNINELVPHKVIGKLGFGAPYKALCCKISKANDGE